MKEVPTELIVWLGGLILAGLGAFLSVASHLLIRIYVTVQDLNLNQKLMHAANQNDIESLKRHETKNEEEMAWMRDHLRRQGVTQ